MRNNFYGDEKKVLDRIKVFQELIGESELYNTPCPLLDAQLIELKTVTEFLHSHISKLQNKLKGIK